MHLGAPLFLLACCLAAARPLVADTIVITETTTATGTLYVPSGHISFTDAALVLTYTGDTSATTSYPTGGSNFGGVTTTSIAGLGTSTNLVEQYLVWYAFVQQSGSGALPFGGIGSSAGHADGTGDFTLDAFGNAFATYELSNSFGPYTGITYSRAGGYGGQPTIYTDAGTFVFDTFGSTTTYQATVSSTPEPSSLVLLGTGVTGIVGLALRRYFF